MAKKKKTDQVVIYQTRSGALALRSNIRKATIWATQAEMARIFDVNPQAITKHLKNIYREKELLKKATCSKVEHVQIEGGRTVRRTVEVYNLDAIIAVGYRISSIVGTRFRQWATKTLRQYIVEGYAIDRKRIAGNYQNFLESVERVKRLLPLDVAVNTQDILELVNVFADTWLSLDAYDKGKLSVKGVTKKRVALTTEKIKKNLDVFKLALVKKGEASEYFGIERQAGVLDGIVSSVMQSFSGKDLYDTAEEKAAHLLYFMVKSHPFVDGNKRSGAYVFIWFLRQVNILNTARLTPPALTALTLLVAESDPKDKEKIIKLITSLL
ncbi:MAG: virulence protein RhuM/Fic/DOC family protein [Patescibacteria group bacterium]|nr:virulence protein RhuM/Fic/DOC family protein [Patescibacteria group bacterium]